MLTMLTAFERLAGRRGRCLLVAAVAGAATGLSAAPAFAAPQLGITMTHVNLFGGKGGVDPFTGSGETFARESGSNTYTITVTNIGNEATSGPVTVRDQLPPGMFLFAGPLEHVVEGAGWNCTVAPGGVAAACSTSAPLEKNQSYGPITLRVHVNPQATNPSTNVAEVSGGGAGEASTTPEEGKTTVTEAVPFGSNIFTTSVFNESKEPFSQAGGHPFEYSTEFVLNYTTKEERILAVAGGGVKGVQVELPPGFVGNPQNVPRCPLEVLFSKVDRCPADTVVGYIHVSIGGGIEGGGKVKIFEEPLVASEFSSLVYNVEPTYGHVVALGFVLFGLTPFVLEGNVRSDGDYGVTVGDSANPQNPRVLGVRLTTCENGASGPGGIGPNFSCNAAPPGSKPFLTNPTECSGPAPVTTLRMNPWAEPANDVSKTVGTNLVAGALSAKSFATGCESLLFHPELELKPSPPPDGGTSQADEPTGMTLALKLPQTKEEPGANATPALKNAVVTLPAGVTLSSSAADGLQACSNAQFGLGTEFGLGSEHSEPAKPASCPLASQIGTVEVFTPLLSGAPAIEGVQKKSQELMCSQGMWNGSPTLSYQWLRGGAAITGATGSEYVVVTADEGKALQCQVTATNEGGSSVAVSRDAVVLPEPSPVPPFPPPSIAAPSGTASVPNTLTCENSAWTSSTAPGFTYKWLRNGVAITGASTVSYKLTSEDEGKAIQCQVGGTNESGEVIVDSAALVVPPVPSPPPPLPGGALQGQMFVGEPECSPCSNEDAENGKLFRLFIQAQNPSAGVIVKLHGTNSVNPVTGQITSTFVEQPQQPFELLQLKLKGGSRAPLANPQSCGPATTTADLTPWSAPGFGGLTGTEPIAGTPDATPSGQFNVDFNGAGGACPGALPFTPAFNAGTTGANATAAGASSSFSLTFSREDREQDLSGLQVHMPLGLVAKIAGIPRCGEAQANAGTCGPQSEIGTAESGAGPGGHPFFVKGRVFLTGPYKGAPFGLSVVTPAVAGPFNLGNVIVRSAINIDPHTAAVTVTSDPLPQIIDGVPLRLRKVNVNVNRSQFMLNPTNCSAQQVSATLSSAQGASAHVSSPFGIGGCTSLPFSPTFTASTEGHTSKAGGASLDVKITYPPGAYANIAKTVTDLPTALPSRLTTLQKACVDTVFEANPAACPEGSVVGHATAHTPLLNNPLAGPAYLVSHGNRAFPDIEIVLQGEGIMVVLDGQTEIKKGVTETTFQTLPDSPVSTFELILPEGPHSALAANGDLCTQSLFLPTTITGQNGAVIKQNTKLAVTGCAPAKPSLKVLHPKLKGNALLLTITTSAKGTVKISGKGLKTVIKKNLNPGTHRIRVPLTKAGTAMLKHHKKATVRVSLIVGKQAVARTATVRL
jgi:uncharacterized repeat protein (TIGR01451 family)